jgi:orotidine-5'-phosphate decarboxylase
MRHFKGLLESHWSQGHFVCVGLDSEFSKLPASILKKDHEGGIDIAASLIAFNKAIIEATHDIVCAYKPNTAFYEAYGVAGMVALEKTVSLIHEIAPTVPVILDAKRADIGNTNTGTVAFAFHYLQADAITLHPFLGKEALEPFLACKEKGIIILCRTSNEGSGEFQQLSVNGVPLYQVVAERVAAEWNSNDNCSLVVGATYPEEIKEVRLRVGKMPLLIPGIGAQGGSVEKTVAAARNEDASGMIINSSRGIIFASSDTDFAGVARCETEKLHLQVKRALS